MELLSTFRIKNKIIIIIFIIGALATVIGNAVNYMYEINYAKGQLATTTKLHAKLIAENCWFPMEFNYPRSAHDVLQKLHTIPDIHDAVLYAANDTVFASYHKDAGEPRLMFAGLKDSGAVIESAFLHLRQPVVHGDKVYGYVYLRSSIDWADIVDRRIKISALIIVSMLIIIFILAYAMQGYISDPVVRLTEEMHSVARTKDYTVQLHAAGTDEIAELYGEFNTMLSEIHKREIDLLQEKERLSVTLRSIGDGVITTDTAGRIVMLNKAAEAMTGWTSDDAAGRTLPEVFVILNEITREVCANLVE